MKKIMIFGTGSSAQYVYNLLNYDVNLICYVENDAIKLNKYFNGKKIISPLEIKKYEFDYIIIASQYYKEIEAQLLEIKIDNNKLINIFDFNCKLENYEFFKMTNVKILNRGLDNKICVKKGMFKKVDLSILGNSNILEIEDECNIVNVIININGNNNKIVVENNVSLNNCNINMNGENNELIIKSYCSFDKTNFIYAKNCTNGKIIINKATTCNGANLCVSDNNIEINFGYDCMLSEDIDIMATDTHSVIDNKTKKRLNYSKSIFIDNHVWICKGAKVLKGVKIKEGSIISMNAVVTKDVDKNVIVAGNPSRVVRKNINWERELI